MDSLVYVRSGPLALSPDTGAVYFDRGDESEPEHLGFVGNADDCPDDMGEDWAVLLQWWQRSTDYGAACARTAEWSYCDRIGPCRD